MKIGIFFGTNTGNTEAVVEKLEAELSNNGFEVDKYDMSSASVDDMSAYDTLIIASPTWNDGELQDDWAAVIDEYSAFDFSGKKVGLLGTGDQDGYPDNFVDALGILGEPVLANGGQIFGWWDTEGYSFDNSLGVKNGKFYGLAIDVDNQDDLTDERIAAWVKQIKAELGA